MDDNLITDNGEYGVYHYSAGAVPIPTGNTITGNGHAARLPFSALLGAEHGNSFTANTDNTLYIVGDSLSRSLSLNSDQAYYLVSGETGGRSAQFAG